MKYKILLALSQLSDQNEIKLARCPLNSNTGFASGHDLVLGGFFICLQLHFALLDKTQFPESWSGKGWMAFIATMSSATTM